MGRSKRTIGFLVLFFCISIQYAKASATVALVRAVRDNNLENVRNAFSSKEQPNISVSLEHDMSLIHVAVLNSIDDQSAVDIIDYLAEKKSALLNRKDDLGQTPLHLAASEGAVLAIKMLLKRGANPNTKDKAGKTPIELAARWGHDEAFSVLVENEKPYVNLLEVPKIGHFLVAWLKYLNS